MKIYSHSIQGKRPHNEDEHYTYDFNTVNILSKKIPATIIAVFDGHGGKTVSYALKKNLINFIFSNISIDDLHKSSRTIDKVFKIYNMMHQKLILDYPRIIKNCGSTACVLIRYLNKDNKPRLWVFNVGDSRVIKCNKADLAEQLSNDHKPSNPSEKERIESLGGIIKFDGADWRIQDLSVSRAFGDISSTPYITHLPEIYRYKLSKDDKFIIMACDGLWDVLSNQDATDFVLHLLKSNYKGDISEALVNHAYKSGSTDNITAIVMLL